MSIRHQAGGIQTRYYDRSEPETFKHKEIKHNSLLHSSEVLNILNMLITFDLYVCIDNREDLGVCRIILKRV